MTLLLAACLWLAPAARAQDDGSPANVEQTAPAGPTDEGLARDMSERLKSDSGVADSLAERINNSSLAAKISAAPDDGTRLAEIRRWISSDPDSAARVAVGLAQDDAEGSHRFEEALNRSVRTRLQANPGARNGIFGRLKTSGGDSKLLKKQAEMTDEEKREIVRTFFEGKGNQSNKIITQEEKESHHTEAPGGSSSLASSYYDRLSLANLRGYSPELQALQSALNSRRAPGAPKLIETGKLDFATLSYPSYGMRFDIGNLERGLVRERNFALARLLGREGSFTAEQLEDPALSARLEREAGGKKLNERFERRRQALERAALAVREFDASAALSRNPAAISRGLLGRLGEKQKEASRWITAAFLEGELSAIAAQEGFMRPELLAAISAEPLPEGAKAAYRRRGEEFKGRLAKLKADDEKACGLLESSGWAANIGEIGRLLDEGAVLRKDLNQNIGDYVSAAFRLAGLSGAKPRWREWLDRCAEFLFPESAYARGVAGSKARREIMRDVFAKIARGDLEAAHVILASGAGAGR